MEESSSHAPEPHQATTEKHYLMCPPEYFSVEYAINPWMEPTAGVDRSRALEEWGNLRSVLLRLGHRVSLIDPVSGLPDMVFAASGGVVVDGRVYAPRFAHAERADEAAAYVNWFRRNGIGDVLEAEHTNEGEGDFIVLPDVILAGTGFRTTPAAHLEAERFLGRPVVTLHLVDPRLYHLDTALFALDRNIAYYPGAFSAGSVRILQSLFPDAVIASEDDALSFALNSLSDGRNVIMDSTATVLGEAIAERGYNLILVPMSELHKAGGGAKCCLLEIRE